MPQEPQHKPEISLGFCKSTLRGIGRTNPEESWYAKRLLSRHFDITYSDRPDFLIYGDAGTGEHLEYPPDTIRIFITGENIGPNWSEADYALTHERIYSERHWRVPLHRHWYDTTCTRPVRDFAIVKSRVHRFCNFIYSNANAPERIEFFDRLSRYRRVDSGGSVRNNLSYRVDDKLEFIRHSKFTIAFENESHEGYATEKIIQPLLEGSIPIYWGDPTIELDFNPDCFINVHRFNSFDDVVQHVARVDADDVLWKQYVTAPIFRHGTMPIELSDEALVGFFRRIFSSRKHRVSKPQKLWQRERRRLSKSPLGGLSSRVEHGATRRLSALTRRLVARAERRDEVGLVDTSKQGSDR
jgi:alpha(1,3/1,4) fucosyltransferase